jgi:serine/threonine protein kinase
VELTPGSILLAKYRIDELIGTGGMGNVVRASHLYLHQPVAIKLLLPQMVESESTVQRFLREAQATVKLRSEHIARVMDVGTAPDGTPFMVMEFLDGNDLNQILRHHGPQQPAIVVDLMLQACEGIAEAHALGIIHRDIKPSNFFITRRPDGSMLLKILDFGISKTPIGYDELTGTQTVIGTPSYMPPEQMTSGRSADPRSDIWSIGVVMYQLMSGRPPFSGESYADLVLKVGLEPPAPILVPLPAGLGEVILRCLEKDPAARYQTVAELARTLAPYATDPIAGSQSAARVMRILQQRGAMQGMHGSPLTAGGGLATPIPISPAQLTPRSWPPSHGTSVSRSAGQVTFHTRSGRGWLIAGVAGLCVLAGGGGYAISQISRSDRDTGGPHVRAPLPHAASEPAPAPAPMAAAPAPAAATPAPAPAAPVPAPVPAAQPTTAAAPPAAPGPAPVPASEAPTTWRPMTASPTFVDHAAGARPAEARPAETGSADGRPASPRLVDSKHPLEHRPDGKAGGKPEAKVDAKPGGKPDAKVDAKPEAKSDAKVDAKPEAKIDAKIDAKPASRPAEPRATDARATDAKAGSKPSTRPAKPRPRPSDDLFDNRK